MQYAAALAGSYRALPTVDECLSGHESVGSTMIEPLADASTPRVLRLMSFAVALTLAGIIGAGWTVYRTFQSSAEDMTWALRVEELQGLIVHAADILTMSVRMAV